MAKVLDNGIVCQPLQIDTLPPEYVKKAQLELNEDPLEKDNYVQKLKEMVQGVPNLVSRTDGKFLLKFLRSRKFSCLRALEMIKNYYTYGTRFRPCMPNVLPSSVEHVYRMNFATVLPYRDPNGCAIIVVRCEDVNVADIPFLDAISAALMTLEKAIEAESTQVNGFVCVADMKGFSMQHLNYVGTTTNAFMIISLLQNCFPARAKALHLINEPSIFYVFFNSVKVLMKDKMKTRIHFHKNDLSSLHKHVPAAILPQEYGGDLGPFDNSDWYASVLASERTFVENMNYGYTKFD